MFSTPRFTFRYRRWLKQGDAAFQAVSSSVFADALANGTGRPECLVLSQTYRHLSPRANLVRADAFSVAEGGSVVGHFESPPGRIPRFRFGPTLSESRCSLRAPTRTLTVARG